MACQSLSNSERQAVVRHFGEGEEVLYAEWVTKHKDGSRDRRILAVGEYRVVTFRKKVSLSVAREGPLVELQKVTSLTPQDLYLVWPDFVFKCEVASGESVDGIIHLIQRAFYSFGSDFPDEAWFQLNCNRELPALTAPPKQSFGGFVNTYKAYCVSKAIPVDRKLIQLVLASGSTKEIDLSTLFSSNQAEVDISALAQALMYNTWFESVRLSDANLPDAARALACTFERNAGVRSLTLSGLGISDWLPLWRAFSSRPDGTAALALEEIDISANLLKERGVDQMSGVLSNLANLRLLDVSSNKISKSGIVKLCTSLALNNNVYSMVALNLSDNHMGQSGTQALCKVLNIGLPALRTLLVARCEVDVLRLSRALADGAPNVTALDIGGTTLNKKACASLEHFVAGSVVNDLDLSGCTIPAKGIAALVEVLTDRNRVSTAQITLDDIRIGTKESAKVAAALAKATNLTSLSIDHAQLKAAGLIGILNAIEGKADLKSLSITRNVKETDKRVADAIDAIVRVVGTLPSLEDLSFGGSKGWHVGARLMPVVVLAKNLPLKSLDVANQQCGEGLLYFLGDLIKENDTLQSLNFDGNNVTHTAMSSFARNLVEHNHTILNVVHPIKDIRTISRTAGREAAQSCMSEMRAILQRLRENRNLVEAGEVISNTQASVRYNEPPLGAAFATQAAGGSGGGVSAAGAGVGTSVNAAGSYSTQPVRLGGAAEPGFSTMPVYLRGNNDASGFDSLDEVDAFMDETFGQITPAASVRLDSQLTNYYYNAAVKSEVNKMERMSLALLDPDLQFDESAAILRRTRLASNASRRTSVMISSNLNIEGVHDGGSGVRGLPLPAMATLPEETDGGSGGAGGDDSLGQRRRQGTSPSTAADRILNSIIRDSYGESVLTDAFGHAKPPTATTVEIDSLTDNYDDDGDPFVSDSDDGDDDDDIRAVHGGIYASFAEGDAIESGNDSRRGTNDTVESSESGAWMSGAGGNGERRGTTDSEASDRFSRKGLQAGSHLSMSAFSPLAASASHDNDYDDGVAGVDAPTGEARDGQGAGGERDVASPSGAADDLPSETPFSIEEMEANQRMQQRLIEESMRSSGKGKKKSKKSKKGKKNADSGGGFFSRFKSKTMRRAKSTPELRTEAPTGFSTEGEDNNNNAAAPETVGERLRRKKLEAAAASNPDNRPPLPSKPSPSDRRPSKSKRKARSRTLERGTNLHSPAMDPFKGGAAAPDMKSTPRRRRAPTADPSDKRRTTAVGGAGGGGGGGGGANFRTTHTGAFGSEEMDEDEVVRTFIPELPEATRRRLNAVANVGDRDTADFNVPLSAAVDPETGELLTTAVMEPASSKRLPTRRVRPPTQAKAGGGAGTGSARAKRKAKTKSKRIKPKSKKAAPKAKARNGSPTSRRKTVDTDRTGGQAEAPLSPTMRRKTVGAEADDESGATTTGSRQPKSILKKTPKSSYRFKTSTTTTTTATTAGSGDGGGSDPSPPAVTQSQVVIGGRRIGGRPKISNKPKSTASRPTPAAPKATATGAPGASAALNGLTFNAGPNSVSYVTTAQAAETPAGTSAEATVNDEEEEVMEVTVRTGADMPDVVSGLAETLQKMLQSCANAANTQGTIKEVSPLLMDVVRDVKSFTRVFSRRYPGKSEVLVMHATRVVAVAKKTTHFPAQDMRLAIKELLETARDVRNEVLALPWADDDE